MVSISDKISTEPKLSTSGLSHLRLAEGTTGHADLYYSKKKAPSQNKITCFVTKTFFAKESYENSKEYRERVLKEFHILRLLNHENIIKAYKAKYGSLLAGSKVVIYLEAGATINLLRLIQKYPELTSEGCSLCYWRQIINGVAYLHQMNVCHRDLKLENMVLDKNHIVKLIDFGLAFVCSRSNNLAVGSVGSPAYMAPEQLSAIQYDGKKADVWSLGPILYYMLAHRYPWKMATHTDAQYQKFVSHHNEVKERLLQSGEQTESSGVRLLPADFSVPADSDSVLFRIFDPDPLTRFSAQEVADSDWVCRLPFCHDHIQCQQTHKLPLSFS